MATPGARERDSSPFRDSSGSTLRPSTASLSSLSRLFSRRSRLDSSVHKSQRPGRFTKVVIDATSEPLHVLSGLMRTLRESNVPGPKLLRLRSEFTHLIGKGAQFEVFGLAEDLSASLKQERGNASEILAQNLGSLAVKRSRAAATRKAVLSRDASAYFTFQLRAAHREIDALCFPPFRNHPNVVKLIGWGLCLDSLENPDEDSPRIPLLILERADCTFTEYLQNKWNYDHENYYSELQSICVDIGQGLQALHSENIAHGDLKPENILMFKQNGRWTAKLCDFGLSADDVKQDESAVVYHGTPCWRAPEVMTQDRTPLLSGSLQACDVFAFGLVVWSAYSRTGQTPLKTSDEKRGNAYDLATNSLRSKTGVLDSELERVLCVVQSALHRDPLQRSARPWELFHDPLTEDKNQEAPLWLYTRWISKNSWSVLSSVVILVMEYAARIWAVMTLTIRSQLKKYYTNLWKPNEPITAIPERQAGYLETYSLLVHTDLDPTASPDSVSPFRHLPANCFDLHRLCDSMQWAINNQADILLYALARIRSRLRLCCWQKLGHGREVNIISAVVGRKHEFETLAWLCRGEIGRYELQQRIENRALLWLSTYDRPASFDFRYISSQSLNAKARVDRFLLFLENGGHIEDELVPHHGSVFLHFLMTLTEFGKAGYGDHRISLICRRFKHLAQQTHTAPQTRYYMTGELPENIDNINDFSTTALHDSVLARHYSAVEQLVRMGFVVNALNDRKMTALQIAMQLHNQFPQSIDTVRILALLKQSTSHPVHIGPSDKVSSTVPLGWEIRSFDLRDREKLEFFYESFTNSHTFRRPKFSLFEDRRLALGYRKILGNGQTYYLDLVRFIDPGQSESKGETASDRKFVFDDEWYLNEPARSEAERSKVEQLRHLPTTGMQKTQRNYFASCKYCGQEETLAALMMNSMDETQPRGIFLLEEQELQNSQNCDQFGTAARPIQIDQISPCIIQSYTSSI